MEATECPGAHERHQQDTGPEGEHVPGLAQLEAPDAADEQVSHGEVEESPQDVDRGGREAFPGRRCERALERVSRDSVAEMRERVRKKSAPEEVGYVVVPS